VTKALRAGGLAELGKLLLAERRSRKQQRISSKPLQRIRRILKCSGSFVRPNKKGRRFQAARFVTRGIYFAAEATVAGSDAKISLSTRPCICGGTLMP
jgi:hypothetical protein